MLRVSKSLTSQFRRLSSSFPESQLENHSSPTNTSTSLRALKYFPELSVPLSILYVMTYVPIPTLLDSHPQRGDV
jgi:hypothetical protein